MSNAHGFVDITYNVAYADMTAKITINRPELHNAFRPITVNEMRRAMDLAQDDRRAFGTFGSLVVYRVLNGVKYLFTITCTW